MLTIAGGIILAVMALWIIAAVAEGNPGCGTALLIGIGITCLLYACS